ncbi:preprotein translocase subunit SecE [Rhodococcus aerolatus]
MSDEREGAPAGSGDDDARPTDRTPDEVSASDESDDTGTAAAAAPRPAGKRRPRRAADGTAATADEPAAVRPTGRRRPATATSEGKGRATRARAVAEAPARRSPVSRVTRFLREVVAELRKVIWPTRPQLVTYTTVVLVFVAFMVALVAGLDLAFAKGVLLIFG